MVVWRFLDRNKLSSIFTATYPHTSLRARTSTTHSYGSPTAIVRSTFILHPFNTYFIYRVLSCIRATNLITVTMILFTAHIVTIINAIIISTIYVEQLTILTGTSFIRTILFIIFYSILILLRNVFYHSLPPMFMHPNLPRR